MKLVVTFPDYQALGMIDFTRRIKAVVPDAIVVPVLNGLSDSQYADAARTWWADGVSNDVLVGARGVQGLLSTLHAGYSAIVDRFPDAVVVRLDTAEHPPEAIPMLAQAAVNVHGMAIGDLVFDETTLREGSIDKFAHVDLFPALFRQATGGKLSLSCAHGFQAFAPRMIPLICRTAQDIVRAAQQRVLAPIEWGFDAAMALAATGVGVPAVVHPVQATTLRDRPRAKIAEQFEQALQMCLAARDIFPRWAR